MQPECSIDVPGGLLCVHSVSPGPEVHGAQRFPFGGGRPHERAAVDAALTALGLPTASHPVGHRSNGAPHFLDPTAPSLSASHTRLTDGRIAAAVYVGSAGIGVDIEVPSDRIARVAPRVFHPDELAACGSDLQRLGVVWCTKEATWKGRGPALVFAHDVAIDPGELDRLPEEGGWIQGMFRGEAVRWWARATAEWCVAVGPFPVD